MLVPRLGINNATAAKGFVNELFFAADRGAVRVSKQLKVDQLRDVDAILPGGEYCQLKLVSADLDYSKSLGAWLEAAIRTENA